MATKATIVIVIVDLKNKGDDRERNQIDVYTDVIVIAIVIEIVIVIVIVIVDLNKQGDDRERNQIEFYTDVIVRKSSSLPNLSKKIANYNV